MNTEDIICPSCFEAFAFPLPEPNEVPCELDYDCEVCCHPMIVSCVSMGDQVVVADVSAIDR